MTDTPQPQFSWPCPGCGRTVPDRFNECRCGCVRPQPTAPAPSAQTPKSSILHWFVLAAVAAAAAGALVALQTTSPPRAGAIGATGLPADVSSRSGEAAEAEARSTKVGGVNPATDASNLDSSAPFAPIALDAPVAPAVSIPDLEDVVSRSIPAIVSIETANGRGSGFFAAPRMVITNRHVVQSNVSVTVRLSSGQALQGRVEASSAEFDLAVVRVDEAPPSQPVLPLGTVNDVRQGQEVIAIGLALGVFQNSVTRGIISAVRRADRTVVLQTDAAINPGNSGGPLLNRHGLVVGINTMKVAGAAESVGFAVAVDHARGMLSGGRQMDTPLSTSAPVSRSLAPAFSTGSSTDNARAEGTRVYDQAVLAAARQAGRVDTFWNRIKANCAVRVAPGYDHEWFGLWDGRASLTAADSSCRSALEEVGELSTEIRGAMSTAREDARRASVLPGQLRDIRRRHRMDWTGFE